MSIRCLIVDDEELARGLISSHIELLDGFEIAGTCATAIEARKILQLEKVDLIFLDIEMPVLKGTDFVKTMANLPSVIFTTAHRDFAIEAFELEAIDYLLKPITFKRLFKATEKFLRTRIQNKLENSLSQDRGSKYIFLRINRKQVKIQLSEVVYVESVKDYVRIHMIDEMHMFKHSLSGFYELLDSRFLQVHRSFIVNMDRVTAYTRNDLEIDKKEIAIGEYYRNNVNRYFEN